MSSSQKRLVEDLTQPGDVDTWIGKGKNFKDAPSFVYRALGDRLTLSESTSSRLPAPTLTVFDLLDHSFPKRYASPILCDAATCFSTSSPTHRADYCFELPLPNTSFITALRTASGQAMLDGHVSICYKWDATHGGVIYLPFETLGVWIAIDKAVTAQDQWSTRFRWLDGAQKSLPPSWTEHVYSVLRDLPWDKTIEGKDWSLSLSDLGGFLSTEWLSDLQINALLSLARDRKVHATDIVASTYWGQHLLEMDFPRGRLPKNYDDLAPDYSSSIGELLRANPDSSRVFSIINTNGSHWSFIYIDCRTRKVLWADSLGFPPPVGLSKRLSCWLKFYLRSHTFSPLSVLPCPLQHDTYSCGAVSVTTLVHHLLGNDPWTDNDRETIRVRMFMDLLVDAEYLKIAGAIRTAVPSQPEAVKIADEPEELHAMDTVVVADSIENHEGPACPVTVAHPIGSGIVSKPGTGDPEDSNEVPGSARCMAKQLTLTGLFGQKSHATQPIASSSQKRQAKRPRTQDDALAASQRATKRSRPDPSALPPSKQTKSKNKLNEEVANGSFQWNSTRLARYKDALAKSKCGYKLDFSSPYRARLVQHERCGSWITMKCVYDAARFHEHVGKCKRTLPTFGSSSLDSYVASASTDTSDPSSHSASTVSGSGIAVGQSWIERCPGLSSIHDTRIPQYITHAGMRTSTSGGDSAVEIAKNKFGVTLSKLSLKKKDRVYDLQELTHRWKIDHVRQRVFAYGSLCCQGKIRVYSFKLVICDNCRSVLYSRRFKNAINKPPADPENWKYIPLRHQNPILGYAFVMNKGLQVFFENDGTDYDDDPEKRNVRALRRFAKNVAAGRMQEKVSFFQLIEVMTAQAEREARGKGNQNMHYPAQYDLLCDEMQAVSPAAYRTFSRHFPARTERNIRKRRAAAPPFTQGIGPELWDRANQYCADYNYPSNAPVALCTDETKAHRHASVRWCEATQSWVIDGFPGGPRAVADPLEIEAILSSSEPEDQLADKLRLYCLVIPLPRIPPLILSVVPVGSKTKAVELAELEMQLFNTLLLNPRPFNIVSFASDGAITERKARRILVSSGYAAVEHHIFPSADSGSKPVNVEILNIKGHRMSILQDPKHGRKTMRNNLFAGPRLLVTGSRNAHYKQVYDIAHISDSPIYRRDVVRLDRQDDLASARLFSAPTFEYVLNEGETHLGLSSILFAFGELIDAYESRTISHLERVKMVHRARVFKTLWKSFLKDAGYSTMLHYISNDADDITNILIDGYLSTLVIFRDHQDRPYPFLPWLHGSEANEHVFGLLRSMIADFTVTDAIHLIPKLRVRLMAACRNSMHSSEYRKRAAGYSHSYLDCTDEHLQLLAIFPSDEDISLAFSAAEDEAYALWEMLGCFPRGADAGSDLSNPSLFSGGALLDSEDVADDSNDAPDSSEGVSGSDDFDNVDAPSDKQLLQSSLDEAANLMAGMDESEENAVNECAFAAASLGVSEQECLDHASGEVNPEDAKELREYVLQLLLQTQLAGQTETLTTYLGILQQNARRTEDGAVVPQVETTQERILTAEVTTQQTSKNFDKLIHLRYEHQSREEAMSVPKSARCRGKWVPTSSAGVKRVHQDNDDDNDEDDKTERQLLAEKVRDIINKYNERRASSGKNRAARWQSSKANPAKGSDETANSDSTGNSANAKVVAQNTALQKIKRRRTVFKDCNVTVSPDVLDTARICSLSRISSGRFGIVVAFGEIMLGEVITMYEKGAGKYGKHSWVSTSTSIGALSYISLKLHHIIRERPSIQFRESRTPSQNTVRYAHIPSAAFLCLIPRTALTISSAGRGSIEISTTEFTKIVREICSNKEKILAAVSLLSKPPPRLSKALAATADPTEDDNASSDDDS